MKINCGIMLSEIPFSSMPVIFKKAGLDFMILDCEHGGFGERAIADIIMNSKLAQLKIIIRLPDNSRRNIIRVMDMGADGVLLPMTNCVEDIEKVVKYAKYAPIGERGISTMRAHTLYDPEDIGEYTIKANANTKVYAQIETKSGLENAEKIIKTQGVDGLFLGPNDLSCDIGCLFNGDKKPILNAIEKLGELVELGTLGIITGDKEYLAKAKNCGFSTFCKGSELHILKSGAKKTVEEIKNL